MKNLVKLVVMLLAISQTAQAGDICAVLFEHANYGGANYVVYNPNANTSYVGDWWNDKVSSVSVLPGCHITLFEHANFGGDTTSIYDNTSYVGNWWNDKASSFACHCN